MLLMAEATNLPQPKQSGASPSPCPHLSQACHCRVGTKLGVPLHASWHASPGGPMHRDWRPCGLCIVHTSAGAKVSLPSPHLAHPYHPFFFLNIRLSIKKHTRTHAHNPNMHFVNLFFPWMYFCTNVRETNFMEETNGARYLQHITT